MVWETAVKMQYAPSGLSSALENKNVHITNIIEGTINANMEVKSVPGFFTLNTCQRSNIPSAESIGVLKIELMTYI